MDDSRASTRRRLPLGLAVGGVLLMAFGTSAVFAGVPVWGIALVGVSLILLVGAVVTLFR